jgi:hypothetical protein
MFHAWELFAMVVVVFPGAGRMRRISPGFLDSNPSGAVYHGSVLGGRGVDEEFVVLEGDIGSAEESARRQLPARRRKFERIASRTCLELDNFSKYRFAEYLVRDSNF